MSSVIVGEDSFINFFVYKIRDEDAQNVNVDQMHLPSFFERYL